MHCETITITLELRLAGDSLTGRCVGPEGGVRPFAGWLGLVAAIDAQLADRPTPAEGDST